MCLIKTGKNSLVECAKHAAELSGSGLTAPNRPFRISETERKAILHNAC